MDVFSVVALAAVLFALGLWAAFAARRVLAAADRPA